MVCSTEKGLHGTTYSIRQAGRQVGKQNLCGCMGTSKSQKSSALYDKNTAGVQRSEMGNTDGMPMNENDRKTKHITQRVFIPYQTPRHKQVLVANTGETD